MSDYEDLIAEAARMEVQLDLPREPSTRSKAQSPADIVFHTPILALTILTVASTEKHFLAGELSRWSSSVLTQLCYGTTKSLRKMEWSVILHIRCAEALDFLETAGFVSVAREDREIQITQMGREFLKKGLKGDDHTAQLLRDLMRAHAFVRSRGFTLL